MHQLDSNRKTLTPKNPLIATQITQLWEFSLGGKALKPLHLHPNPNPTRIPTTNPKFQA